MTQLQVLRDSLFAAIAKASDAAMELRSDYLATGRIGTNVKTDKSTVTEADQAAHRILETELPRILDIPVVSEEGTTLAHGAERYWLVDPLDGTKEFLKGRDEWTVNVALIEGGRPVAGLVAAPVLCESWWGVDGGGASKYHGNWTPITARSLEPPRCRVVVSASHRGPLIDAYLENLRAVGYHVTEQCYGSSLKICRVAEGFANVYPRLGPTSEWDTGAADAIIHAAGGTLTDCGGKPLSYGKTDPLNPHFIAGGPGDNWCYYVG